MAKIKGYKDAEREIIVGKGVADLQPYHIKLPAPPAPEQMVNYGLKAEEQFFQRTRLPRKLIEIDQRTRIVGKEGIKALIEAQKLLEANEELSQFVEELWYKRIYGEWQYINGVPTYLTGDHWFYLNFYYLYGYYPDFRRTDAEEFYWWKYCVEKQPNVYGGILFQRRQVGKTMRAGSILLNFVTRGDFKHIGIQSKTDLDAASLFKKSIAPQFKRLPFFFKPLYDTSGSMKSRIDFLNDSNESLDSWIDFRASTDTAYDGETLDRFLLDECGKMKLPADPIAIWDKVKPAFMQDGKIRGRALFCTTVSELEKGGGGLFKKIWDDSSLVPEMKKINELGQTKSGLVPYFCPAYRNIFFDQYGDSIEGTPKQYQIDWRKKQKHQYPHMGGIEYVDKLINSETKALDRQRKIQQYPRNIREAFQASTTFCYFDYDVIRQRCEYFNYGYSGTPEEQKMKFGNFHWKDGVFGGEAVFIPSTGKDMVDIMDKSRFWISYLPDDSRANKFTIHPVTLKKVPANWEKFAAGADPFKFDTDDVIHKDKMSEAAMHIYAEYDITVDTPATQPEDYLTGDVCLEYLYRADTVDEMCEDFLKAAIYYGTKIFPEKNNRDVVGYFKRTGFEHYLQFDMEIKKTGEGTYLADKSAGSNTDVKSIQSMFKVVQKYVKEKGLGCKFFRTLEHLKEVSPDNMSPYDLFVSLATCLRVVHEFNPIRLSNDEQDVGDLGDIGDCLSAKGMEESGYQETYGIDGSYHFDNN